MHKGITVVVGMPLRLKTHEELLGKQVVSPDTVE
jgi:hypothetical protein